MAQNLWNKVVSFMGRILKVKIQGIGTAEKLWRDINPRERYQILRAYYDNNDLYAQISTGLEQRAKLPSQLVGLRNPAHQVVEFHVMHLWPGSLEDALSIETESRQAESLIKALKRIYVWSNWATQKQKAARWLARDGDLFIKIVQDNDERVYWQLIDPVDVVDFDLDARGFIIWIRLDIEKTRRDSEGKLTNYMVTEIWNKDADLLTIWEHDKAWGTEIHLLPAPVNQVSIQEEFGIDFIPFVHAPFIASDDKHGKAAIEPGLDKIDEANRMATRLHRQQFRLNDVTWALKANYVDATGRPMPPPEIKTDDAQNTVELGGERVIRLPGNSDLVPTVPQLNYEAFLASLESHLRDMERDLPEMAYHRLKGNVDLSGRAIRLMLGDAIAKAIEARGNAEAALVRAGQMALSIGQIAKIDGFGSGEIGIFENGDFEHQFAERSVIPLTDQERAEIVQILTGALSAGAVSVEAMRIAGYSEAIIERVMETIQGETIRQEEQFAQGVLQATERLRQQNQGQNLPAQGEPAR